MNSLKKRLKFEMVHASTGRAPSAESNDDLCYNARVIKGDAREAEAYIQAFPETESLQKVRTHLSRGSFEAADVLIEEAHQHLSSDSDLQTELLLEQTRLAAYRGDWTNALKLSQQALELSPTGLTQMTLRQIRSLVLFETGALDLAAVELDKAISLSKLFPSTGLPIYIAATAMKIQGQHENFKRAEAMLDANWSSLKLGTQLNADMCLTLLRVELDLQRRQKKSTSALAFATWLLALAMGDDLYQHFATLDIWAASDEQSRERWNSSLMAARGASARIDQLSNEIHGSRSGAPISSSAISLLSANPEKLILTPDDGPRFQTIVLVQRELRIDLATLKITPLNLTKQFKTALSTLAAGSDQKEVFFQTVWESKKFVPHLHDDVVRRLLYRLRKLTGLPVVTSEKGIATPGIFLVNS